MGKERIKYIAALLLSLQRNLVTISVVVLVFAGGISVLLSRVLTRRFGVLTDAKNRTLWMGNSLQINEKLIEQSTR